VILTSGDGTRNHLIYRIWQALKKFLAIPLAMLLVSVLLSAGLYGLDRNTPAWLQPLRAALGQRLFVSSDVTGAFLGTVAGGMFTQTSIVVSMLLLVLQQTASTMGNFIYDQFLRRHRNQVYAGYVVGTLSLALSLRATVNDTFNPILGATGVLLLSLVSMGLLIWFLYSTIQQMRPEFIVETIHEETNRAWHNERTLLHRLRSKPQVQRRPDVNLRAETHGYLTEMDVDALEDCLSGADHNTEIVLKFQLGDYIAYRDLLAEVKAPNQDAAEQLAYCLGETLRFSDQRNMAKDSDYGIKQLETIGWTEMSTAKDNPETGIIVLHVLRNLMSLWITEISEDSRHSAELPVVYSKNTLKAIITVWESLVTVSSGSMQHQAFAEILHSLATVYPRLPTHLQDRADALIRRAISAMGDHVLTEDVDSAIHDLSQVLRGAAHHETATVLEEARHQLAASVGTLANRSTRVKQASSGSSSSRSEQEDDGEEEA
jgi:uncharacterized membrane protein